MSTTGGLGKFAMLAIAGHGECVLVRVWAGEVLDEIRAMLPSLKRGTTVHVLSEHYTDAWGYTCTSKRSSR